MLWSNFFLGKVSLQGWEGVCQFVFPWVWEWLEHLVIHRPASSMFLAFGSRTTCICTYMNIIFIVMYMYIQCIYICIWCISAFDSFWRFLLVPKAGPSTFCGWNSLGLPNCEFDFHPEREATTLRKTNSQSHWQTGVVRLFSFKLPYFKAPVSKGPSFWVSNR